LICVVRGCGDASPAGLEEARKRLFNILLEGRDNDDTGMIEAQSLTRSYGAVTAVRDLSFSIGANEVVGLLGHNGAGKTTVMRMLSGCLEPSSGRVLFAGTDLADDPRRLQAQLGYLPEALPLYPDMLVADYLDYVATLRGISRERRMDSVAAVLTATDLMSRALHRVGTLSRGMRQRVGVAQALLDSPRLLILDEPTTGLDPEQTLHMRQLIRRLARRATVILSTHIMQEVSAVCDRVLLLRDGALVVDARLDELQVSRTLLLHTDTLPSDLAGALARLPQVRELLHEESSTQRQVLRLALHEQADIDVVSSVVAHHVFAAGVALQRLHPESADLNQLFYPEPDHGD